MIRAGLIWETVQQPLISAGSDKRNDASAQGNTHMDGLKETALVVTDAASPERPICQDLRAFSAVIQHN